MKLVKLTLENAVDQVLVFVDAGQDMAEVVEQVADHMLDDSWLDADTEVIIDDVPRSVEMDTLRPFVG